MLLYNHGDRFATESKENSALFPHLTFQSNNERVIIMPSGVYVRTEKYRKIMSKAMKGREISKEHREKIAEGNKGKIISEETRLKISKANKGKSAWNKGKENCFSDETKRKMSESHIGHIPWNKGKKLSEETKKKIGEAGKGRIAWNKNKQCPEETKIKISKANKGKQFTKETILKMAISRIENNKYQDNGYCDIWRDPEYKNDLRKQYCEICGMSRNLSFKLFGKKLNLHHDKGNYDCAPNDILTLCNSCHTKLHRRS